MAVTILGQKFYEQIQNEETYATWSLFCIGERLRVETEVEVFTQITFTVAAPIVSGNALNINQLFNASGKFASFAVGDTIKITDSSGFWNTAGNQQYTILQKYSNNLILVSDAIGSGLPIPANTSSATAVLYNLTPVDGVEFDFNFIENNEPNNFNSKINGAFQKLTAGGINNASLHTLTHFNGNEWHASDVSDLSTCTIQRTSIDTSTGKQIFLINHKTVVTPTFLAAQFTDFSNDIAPAYYLNNACLKYIVKIIAHRNINDPNTYQSKETDPAILGNSGWGNELYNGGPKDYEITNVQFKQGSTIITALPLTIGYGNSIEFDIDCIAGTNDFSNDQRICIAACKLPNSESEYQNNGRYFNENFLYINYGAKTDNVFRGSAYYTPTNVYNFIDSWKAELINPNKLHVTINIGITQEVFDIFSESTTPRFLFWAMLANSGSVDVETQNKQVIWTQAYEFDTDVMPADAGITQNFKRHYEDENDTGIDTNVTTFKNDECVVESVFFGTFKETPANVDEITPTKFYVEILAKRISDGAEFLLEDWNLPVTVPYVANEPLYNYSNNRIFKIPTAEIRKVITLDTVDFSVSPGDTYFVLNYPFMIRWEKWLQLIGVNADFFNPSQPNNGFNQDWFHYLTSNWEIYFRTKVDVNTGVGTYQFSKDLLLPINDYASNTDFTVKKVESFKMDGTTQLLAGGNNYIQANENTIVRATFTKTGGLDVDNAHVVFGIEVKNQGGIGGRVRFSSVWETSPTTPTWFIPISGTDDKVILTQINSTTIKAEAVIDYLTLPQGNITYDIVARLYEDPAPPPEIESKFMSDGTPKLMSDGTLKVIS